MQMALSFSLAGPMGPVRCADEKRADAAGETRQA
jgi:hypothetical protein